MSDFVIQEWHILVALFTLAVGVLKSEIVGSFNHAVMVFEQRRYVGKTVKLLNAGNGEWNEVRINRYQYEIPFFRSGGVFITHKENGSDYIQEKISFTNWASLRIRVP